MQLFSGNQEELPERDRRRLEHRKKEVSVRESSHHITSAFGTNLNSLTRAWPAAIPNHMKYRSHSVTVVCLLQLAGGPMYY